ncbi:HDOD domain-containing protein [Marinobacter sp. V034]|uniref:HDOD domain-containing protein n=1 Tax=Marinobacter sp. V034 TaxID=3459610 RepID=UPI004044B6DE
MDVLILEDDLMMSELLQTIVAGLYGSADLKVAGDLATARSVWSAGACDLAICDWNLPDGSGLEFVRWVRQHNKTVPIVMVTARADRDSVLAAAHHGINGFITKPFDIVTVHDRLQRVLPVELAQATEQDFVTSLSKAAHSKLHLPVSADPSAILDLMAASDEISVSDLAARWKSEVGLSARLLDIANSSSYRRSGEPCNSLIEAIATLGVKMSLNQALGVALDMSHGLADERLRNRADAYINKSRALAQCAQDMASRVGVDPSRCYAAGILYCLGELAVLVLAQQHINGGGSVAEAELDQALEQWSGPLGNTLKLEWRLPLDLRELIGAIHSLPHGPENSARVMMRAAMLITEEQADSEECKTLLRRIGLTPKPEPFMDIGTSET